MIKKVKLENEDCTSLNGAAYESRGDFIFLLQLLRNYNEDNNAAIDNLYNKLIIKIVEEQLIIQEVSKKYVPLEDIIYKKTFDSNSGQMIYDKKYNIEILNLYHYDFTSFIQFSPYQYIEINKFNKILSDKNKVKIKEILNDAYNGNDELRKMSRLIEKQYKTTDESKLFFDILGNVILEFKIIGENNE